MCAFCEDDVLSMFTQIFYYIFCFVVKFCWLRPLLQYKSSDSKHCLFRSFFFFNGFNISHFTIMGNVRCRLFILVIYLFQKVPCILITKAFFNIAWNQSVMPLALLFFLKIVWVIWNLGGFIQILEIFALFLWKMSLEFW